MKNPDAVSDRTLELIIIRAAADLVRGSPIMITMHNLRTAIEELARRNPEGYPLVGGVPRHPLPWPEAPDTDALGRRQRAEPQFILSPEDEVRYHKHASHAAASIPGRPETWPVDDLENATGRALEAAAPGHPRIPMRVHSPFGSHPEGDQEYRDRLRAVSRHDIGRIHCRALDVAEHTFDAIGPKGGYSASSASRALTVGIITAIFEEIERRRTSATARAEHTYRPGDEVEVDASAHGWCPGTVKHANDWGVVVYWSYGDGKVTGSTPVPWDEVRGRVRRRGEYQVGDEVEVKTAGPGSRGGAVWEAAAVQRVEADRIDVEFKYRKAGGWFSRNLVRRPTR